MNSFISIIYPALGNFNLASIFLLGKDDSGNVLSSSWELSDLSESQREAYNTLVEAIKSEQELWTVSQGWIYPGYKDGTLTELTLKLEAVSDSGNRFLLPDRTTSDPAYLNLYSSFIAS